MPFYARLALRLQGHFLCWDDCAKIIMEKTPQGGLGWLREPDLNQ